MKHLLQAIFNEPITPMDCRAIKHLGFDGVRIDAQGIWDLAGMKALLDQVLDAGLWPLVILLDGRACAWLPQGTAVELRNEPDIEGPTPAIYRDLLYGMRATCNFYGLELWAGVVSNLIDRGFNYLSAIADALPDRVSVHWYPHRPWLQAQGHEGRTREEEVEELRRTIGDREFGVSEFGFHTAKVCRGFWWWKRCRALTDDEAYEAIRAEFQFWSEQGAAFATLYQLNDGFGDGPLDRYGIRDICTRWKRQAEVLL